MRAAWRSLAAPAARQGLARALGTAARPLGACAGAGASGDAKFAREKTAAIAFAGVVGAAMWAGQAAAGCEEQPQEDKEKEHKTRGGRRHLLKKRSKLKEKREEVDSMKAHLDEYKRAHKAAGSARARFSQFASQTVAVAGKHVPAMTFTDFVHSFILPRYHTRSPNTEIKYSCDFVGNADGLITFEECYLLIHLLQIPKEHFTVAFCMFDLDGDGSVDKAEFCDVIEHLLRVIATQEGQPDLAISAEDTLPRLTKHLFGILTKTITADDLGSALDQLRKQILRAEFDLYAKKNKSQTGVSVHDFAITLVSGFDPEKLAPYLDRVQALHASDEMVSWDDFFKFHFTVQNHLKDIQLAFELTGADEITEVEFIRAARVVSGVELPLSVVKLAFRIFDNNDNGTLDQSELFRVLEMRNTVDLRLDSSQSRSRKFWNCVKEQQPLA